MAYLIFILIMGTIGIIASFSLSTQIKWKLAKLLLPILSFLFLTAAFSGYNAFTIIELPSQILWFHIAIMIHFLVAVSLLELNLIFLGKNGLWQYFYIKSKPIKLRYFWRPAIVISVFSSWIFPWFIFIKDETELIIKLSHIGEFLFTILFGYYIITLYIVEKIFRNTSSIQKRVFTLYLASTALISLGSMILIVHILFYRQITFEIVQIHAALCAIFFPGMLIGLAKYRLWQEKIVIDRGMIHTSFTFLFFGIFLIILGIIASLIRIFGINFTHFEEFVLLFTFLFISLITIFSPQMRKVITAYTRKYIYKSKYDYRDQLIRLHTAHQTTGNIEQTIGAFIDNIKFTILVDNAYIFINYQHENQFIQLEEVNHRNNKKCIIRSQSLLIKLFENDTVSAISTEQLSVNSVKKALQNEKSLIESLSISHFFPIKHHKELLGILGINAGKRIFDSEDLMLILMFCESIGTIIFRESIQHENIERKQFESFTHMASFIVHDIKNQVATLSLVTNNARSNIENPDFHPVLLRSLENCSVNLNTLISKLQSPPKKDNLQLTACDCNSIVLEVVEETKNILPPTISIKINTNNLPLVNVDTLAFFYILKNLLINAIEALGSSSHGTISCTTGRLNNMVDEDTCHFGLLHINKEKYSIYITIEDNGPGMTNEFIEQRLFKPFNTTKDKGIGIGLYQCKTLIETMGGKILCWSEKGKGTRFCILL